MNHSKIDTPLSVLSQPRLTFAIVRSWQNFGIVGGNGTEVRSDPSFGWVGRDEQGHQPVRTGHRAQRQNLQCQRKEDRRRAERANSAVAKDFERALAIASRSECVRGVGERIEMVSPPLHHLLPFRKVFSVVIDASNFVPFDMGQLSLDDVTAK